ncbi:MAG TPA: hypothetical protein VGB28_02800 [Actinomycetota bacterium]
MSFEDDLRDLGFSEERTARSVRQFARRDTPFLTFWLQVRDDGSALFTWEFAIAEYVATVGMQVGSDEHLNTFLYPRTDEHGPQDAAWVAGCLERAETALRGVSLLEG